MNMQPLALHMHMKPVTQVKFNREGDLLFSCSKDVLDNKYSAAVWNANSGQLIGTYKIAGSNTAPVAGFDINGSTTLLATAMLDLKTILWKAETGEPLATIDHKAPARCAQFSHSDDRLMVVTDKKMGQPGAIQLFNLPANLGVSDVKSTFNPCATFETPEAIMYAEWGPTNDTIYFGSDDGSVSILDVEHMKIVRENPSAHGDEVRKLHFDSNYFTLVTASKDKTAKLLDSRDLKTIQTYTSDLPINDAQISPIADHVIAGGGVEAQDVTTTGAGNKFEIKYYHKVHGTNLGAMRCHFGTINTLAFHPSGRKFASGSVDGFVKVFNFDDAYLETPGAKPIWTFEP